MTIFFPPTLAWRLYIDTPHRTMRVEIPPGEDYLIVIADHDPHPQDWAMVLAFIGRVCPASPAALGVAEYDGSRDLWTALYDDAALRAEVPWL